MLIAALWLLDQGFNFESAMQRYKKIAILQNFRGIFTVIL